MAARSVSGRNRIPALPRETGAERRWIFELGQGGAVRCGFRHTPVLQLAIASSRCCANCSMRLASAAASRRREAIRSLTIFLNSGMFDSCNSADGGDEILPALALGTKHLAALRGQGVTAAAALFGLLHPAAIDQALLLQPVKQRVKRGDVKLQSAARPDLNQLGNFIAVAGVTLQQRQPEARRFPFSIPDPAQSRA